MKEFRVTVSVRNNLLIQRREELGLTRREFAARVGITYQSYWALETMRTQPRRLVVDGNWTKCARKIAAFHGLPPEDLWPDVVLSVRTSASTRTLSASEVCGLASGAGLGLRLAAIDPENAAIQREAAAAVAHALGTLTPRERQSIEAYVRDDKTLEEIGREHGVSGVAARRTIGRGFEKLLHPSRTRKLREHL